jgi:Spy/CpxP family protein refolding chaperone
MNSTNIRNMALAMTFVFALLANPALANDPHGASKPEGSGSMVSGGHGGSEGYGHEKKEGSHGTGYGHREGSGHGGHEGHSPFSHILKYRTPLALTPEQVDQIQKLDFEYQKQSIQTETDLKIACMELENTVHSGTVDEAKIRLMAGKMAEAKTKGVNAMAEAKIAVLKLLTPEQLKKMKDMRSRH